MLRAGEVDEAADATGCSAYRDPRGTGPSGVLWRRQAARAGWAGSRMDADRNLYPAAYRDATGVSHRYPRPPSSV